MRCSRQNMLSTPILLLNPKLLDLSLMPLMPQCVHLLTIPCVYLHPGLNLVGAAASSWVSLLLSHSCHLRSKSLRPSSDGSLANMTCFLRLTFSYLLTRFSFLPAPQPSCSPCRPRCLKALPAHVHVANPHLLQGATLTT